MEALGLGPIGPPPNPPLSGTDKQEFRVKKLVAQSIRNQPLFLLAFANIYSVG